MIKVCKFGGTSMATADAIRNIESIIKSDNSRKYIVVSAPGKRFSSDEKVTDLLYQCHAESIHKGECKDSFAKIRDRFNEIATLLGVSMGKELDEAEDGINYYKSSDYAASRGEYLGAILFSKYIKYPFIDAVNLVIFNADGTFNEHLTNDAVDAYLFNYEYAIIPGFYGAMPSGDIKTFSRGGSYISGAIVAGGVNADVYENWTDVNGFMTADPRIVKNPQNIAKLTYKELRELSYMGASVLHPESVFPVGKKGIPINIKNTFEPQNEGTMIVKKGGECSSLITGIAGKKGFLSLTIEKSMMNNQVGFARRVLSVFEQFNVSIEHTPSGIDTYSIVVAENEVAGKLQDIIDAINKKVAPEQMEVFHKLALIATVGRGMASKVGTAARLFKALSDNNINVRMIDQGSSELNIIVGVEEADYDNTIKSIYNEFIG